MNDDKVVSINYFSAIVDGVGDPSRPNRQLAYLAALKTDQRVNVQLGSFIRKTIDRPVERLAAVNGQTIMDGKHLVFSSGVHTVNLPNGTQKQLAILELRDSFRTPNQPSLFARVHTREEKGSDVNLAVQLLNRAWNDEYDKAFVISNDSDLCEPIRIVKEERGKNVTILFVPQNKHVGSVSTHLKKVASSVLNVSPSRLRRHQLPNVVNGTDGSVYYKPTEW